MRSLQVTIRSSRVGPVLDLARAHGAREPVSLAATSGRSPDGQAGAWSVLLLRLPNDRVGEFVRAVTEQADDALFALQPVATLPLATPIDRISEEVRDVARLSTLEVVVASLQSIGAWRGILGFSVLAGIVGAYGLVFDVIYLLVGAMLINPMGAPAMVSVIGLAIGDARMFGHGAVRFLVSLAVQATAALAFGFACGLDVSTSTMEQVTSLSAWAVLLAAAAGAAGALAQVKSERDSLVSGSAAGFMVAAALAPPAAVLGLAVPLGRWDYTGLMAFLLLLQFAAIAAGGWLVLLAAGVSPGDPAVGRGSRRIRDVLAIATFTATAVLVAVQLSHAPRYVKADLGSVAVGIVRDVVDRTPDAFLVASSARFTRADIARHPGETMLIEITVERREGGRTDEEIADDVAERVRRLAAERMRNVVALVRVSVVPGPGSRSTYRGTARRPA